MLLAGCLHPEPPPDLVIVNGAEPESLDPAIVTGVAEMRITKALFEGLLRLNSQTARPEPALAEQWVMSPDRKVYTFYLRINLSWSTGEPITTADVVYSWRRALDPATAADYAGQLFCIRNAEPYYLGRIKDPDQLGIRALDPFTLRIELEYPLAFFPDLCCFPTLAVVPRQTCARFGDRWLSARPLPSSGAYQLDSWRLNDRVRLRRNPRYWDNARTRNELVDLLPISSPNTALNLYETGVADIVWDKDLVPTELLDILLKRPDFHTYPYLGASFYRFNVTRAPLNDPRVRRAFGLATDRQRLVSKLTRAGEKPIAHLVPDGVANYESPPGLAYNPHEARRLLAAAGFPEGRGFPRLQYAYYAAAGGGSQMPGKIAIELQQMWQETLGIAVELRQIERKVFFSAQSRLDFDLSASSWIGDYNDANTFLDLFTSHSGNNRTGWKNARYDGLIREANSEVDATRRAALFREAESLLVEKDVPIVPLYSYVGFNYFDPQKIEGLSQNLLDEHPIQLIHRRSPSRAPGTQTGTEATRPKALTGG